MAAPQRYWHARYWHTDAWHEGYWGELASLDQVYFHKRYWAGRYFHPRHFSNPPGVLAQDHFHERYWHADYFHDRYFFFFDTVRSVAVGQALEVDLAQAITVDRPAAGVRSLFAFWMGGLGVGHLFRGRRITVVKV